MAVEVLAAAGSTPPSVCSPPIGFLPTQSRSPRHTQWRVAPCLSQAMPCTTQARPSARQASSFPLPPQTRSSRSPKRTQPSAAAEPPTDRCLCASLPPQIRCPYRQQSLPEAPSSAPASPCSSQTPLATAPGPSKLPETHPSRLDQRSHPLCPARRRPSGPPPREGPPQSWRSATHRRSSRLHETRSDAS
jgi:hypothetical protein